MSFERKKALHPSLLEGRVSKGWRSTIFIHFQSSQNRINPYFVAGWLKWQGKPHFTKVNGEVLGEASLPVALGGRVWWGLDGLGRPFARFEKGVWTKVSDYELSAKKAKRDETDNCEDIGWKNMIICRVKHCKTQIDLQVRFIMFMDLGPRQSIFCLWAQFPEVCPVRTSQSRWLTRHLGSEDKPCDGALQVEIWGCFATWRKCPSLFLGNPRCLPGFEGLQALGSLVGMMSEWCKLWRKWVDEELVVEVAQSHPWRTKSCPVQFRQLGESQLLP